MIQNLPAQGQRTTLANISLVTLSEIFAQHCQNSHHFVRMVEFCVAYVILDDHQRVKVCFQALVALLNEVFVNGGLQENKVVNITEQHVCTIVINLSSMRSKISH